MKPTLIFYFFTLFLLHISPLYAHNISIIGTGYVGLTSAIGLAEMGNLILCADIDEEKINNLQKNIVPIYEPGLEDALKKNRAAISFTTNIVNAIQENQIIFIAVGTPSNPSGDADISAIESIINLIGVHYNNPKIIVNRSTVPVGTHEKLNRIFIEKYPYNEISIVSCPEFLREGSALYDFLNPDRLVFGLEDQQTLKVMKEIFKPIVEKNTPIVITNWPTAEMIKYASNAFLATKISFINEIANLADKVGADTLTIAKGMGLDKRISPYFLNPGPGFGGSCFPKDTLALITIAEKKGILLPTIQGAINTNELQQGKGVEKLKQLLGSVEHKVVGILGLSFKPNTDDIRYSPAIKTIELLLKEQATIKAYDPHAQKNMAQLFPTISYEASPYDVASGADALIILTDDPEFKELDLLQIYELMNTPILIDARNILSACEVNALPFTWDSIGRSVVTGYSKTKVLHDS